MQSNAAYTIFGQSFTSGELFFAAAVTVLVLAILLIAFQRHKVVVQRSLVMDEMMFHLSRIADALERNSTKAAPDQNQVLAEIAEALRHRDAAVQPRPEGPNVPRAVGSPFYRGKPPESR